MLLQRQLDSQKETTANGPQVSQWEEGSLGHSLTVTPKDPKML